MFTKPKTSPRVLLFSAAAAAALVATAVLPAAPQADGPAAAAQAAAPGAATTVPAKPMPHDPRWDSLIPWISGIFPWGPGETTVEGVGAVKIKGYQFVKASKSFAADSRANDQAFVALDDAGKVAIVGDPFADEGRMKAVPPQPVRTDADLAPLKEQLQRFLRGRLRLVLDPAADRPSLRGVKAIIDTGYGPYEIGGYVTEGDGGLLILGRAWDRKRSIAEQRKEMIKLAGTPSLGPADATVTVVEYSDMQCGFCKKRTGDWEPLLAKLGGALKIKRYYKSFPLVNDHPWAFRAAAAGRCFFEKDPTLFLRWKSSVYNRQETLTVSDLDMFAVDFAAANDVGDAQLKGCYLQEASSRKILSDLTEGFGLRVRATPTYIIDGVAVSWYVDGLMEDYLRQTYLKGSSAAKGAGPAVKK